MQLFCSLHCEKQNPYAVYDSIHDIKKIWDSLLPENHHLQHHHLELLENTKPAHITFKYLIIQDEKLNPIGCAYLQLLNFNANHYNNEVLNKPKLEKIKSYILKQHTNLLICGNLFRINFQGYYFENTNNNHLLLAVLKHFAKKNPYKINFTGLLIKDCICDFQVTDLKNNRYKLLPEDITMQIDLKPTWNSFDDYKADLSRKYVQRANKIRKAKEQLVLKEFDLEDTISNASLMETLYLNIASKQSIKMGVLNGQYFIEMKKILGDQFKIVGYYFEEQLVAFSSYILENETMEIHYIGFDYQYNETYKLYFNILFDGLELAILLKKKSIELGRTAREAKASAGAKPLFIKNYIWVKLGLPTLVYNYFYKWYNSNISNEWQNRYPFRE